MNNAYVVAMRGRYEERERERERESKLPAVLRPVRTEYGKQVRKQYESGQFKASRHTFQKLEPRFDGISNTITTVLKDNWILVEIEKD